MLKISLLIIAILGIIGGFAFFNYNMSKPRIESRDSSVALLPQNDKNKIQNDKGNENEPPLKLKSIGVNFEDFKFTRQKLEFNRVFMGFGFVIPANTSSSGKAKSNPQPTYVVPLGTPVRSIVDGVVAAIPILWSKDYSVQVTKDGKMQKWVYEMEHLINPKVKVGDKVSAGQIVGEVSNFNSGAPEGFGAVEIGILKGGQIPEHVCPFAYLDDSIKEETFKKMNNLFASWEEYTGDKTLYGESAKIPGCLTDEPIEG